MTKPNYTPESCPHCSQTTTYLLGIDKGTVQVLIQVAKFIRKKGINAVHLRKEMEGSYLTSNQVGNASRVRFHGLIAHIEGEKGNYCLTTKGIQFLQGALIAKYAIISKSEGRNIGYYLAEEYKVTIKDFAKAEEYWEAVGYKIESGRVIQTA